MSYRVLIVDDQPELLRAISRIVSRAGYVVEVYADAESVPTDVSYDCAVLDIDLPGANGLSLARELVESSRIEKIVFFSGTDDIPAIRSAEHYGCFVSKSDGIAAVLVALGHAVSVLSRRKAAVGGGTATATIPPRSRIVKLKYEAG